MRVMNGYWLLVFVSLSSFFQPVESQLRIAGVWEGEMNDLPAVILTVKDDNGKLTGTIIFYFQRQDGNGNWKAERQNEEPLIDPRFVGGKLSFTISHAQAHPGESSQKDPPVPFVLTVSSTSPPTGMLTSDYQGQKSEIKLTKTK